MELEKVKNIVYISCVAVFTLVATVCLTKFTLSASKMMNRFGTRFEEIENHVEKCSESLDKILSEYASDDPPKSGSKGDNLGKILKNAAEISQVAKEKLVGDKDKKGVLENASEICERANNGLKSVHESHIITAKLDTRTDKEKSDEEGQRKKKNNEDFDRMSDYANDILSMPDSLPEDGMFNSNDSEQGVSAESAQTCNIM